MDAADREDDEVEEETADEVAASVDEGIEAEDEAAFRMDCGVVLCVMPREDEEEEEEDIEGAAVVA